MYLEQEFVEAEGRRNRNMLEKEKQYKNNNKGEQLLEYTK